MQVSVGNVENLEDAVRNLNSIAEQLDAACAAKEANLLQKVAETTAISGQCSQELAEAVKAEAQAMEAMSAAEAALATAEAELASAEADLAAAEANVSYDEDGDEIPPDTSSEEAAVSAAEAQVNECQATLEQRQSELEAKKEARMLAERRSELASQCQMAAQKVSEAAIQVFATTRAKVASVVQQGVAALAKASDALQRYLASNPEAKKFYDWIKWNPNPSKPVGPTTLHCRMNLSVEQQKYFLQYLCDRDPAVRAKFADYATRLANAATADERDKIELQARKTLSGFYGEKLVEYAFKPLGTGVSTQSRTVFEDGRYTKTDLVVTGLKVPVILGKGEGMAAPVGGSIAIEVKCGHSAYLKQQTDHMIFQAGGHKAADASVTVCTRDIKDLSPEEQKELRRKLREAGSPLIGMLPKKDDLDEACNEVLEEYDSDEGDE